MSEVILSGSFDNLRSRHMRLLQEASLLGDAHVLLWSDELAQAIEGCAPKFPQEERQYFVESIRYVDRVTLIDVSQRDALPAQHTVEGSTWAVEPTQDNIARRSFCRDYGLHYRVISSDRLEGYPEQDEGALDFQSSDRPKVLVTGCFDWFHSGHVRFFEEVSQLGDLYVVVGHDRNLRLLKGEGHPMYCEDERRYMAGSVRFVKQAFVSSGDGWLDAEPEIERIKPDIYAVNDDGDRPEKQAFCEARGIEYRVLKRTPKEGLPRRESTHLRGF